MSATVTGQLLAAIRNRKFTTASRLFAPGVDFQAWTPVGHWIANDGATIAKIIEVWYTPGAPPMSVIDSKESLGAKGAATLEIEFSWKLPLDDQTRTLRQVYLLTVKGDRITHARVYCAGLHTEFPEVDLEKQRRAKGIGGLKPSNAPKMVAVRAS